MSICHNFTTDCQSGGNGGDVGDDHGTLAVGLTEVAATHILGHIVDDLAEGLTLIVWTIRNADEIEEHLALFEHEFLNTQLLAQHAEGNDINQLFCYFRDGTETVYQTLAISLEVVVEVVAACEIVEFTIEEHALGVAGDVLLGEVHLDIGFEGAIVDPLTIDH